MLKKVLTVAALLAVVAMPVLAAELPQAAHKEAAADSGALKNLGLALAFGLAIAAAAGAFAQSNAIGKAVDAAARQPELAAKIQGMMIIGLALIETLVIYMLLICLMWDKKVS